MPRGTGVRPFPNRRSRDELDRRVRAEDELRAGLDHAPEAIMDPAARMGRSLDEQKLARQLDGPQRSQPDAVCGLVDGERELGLHARPYVLQLRAHGSVYPLLSQRK